MSQNSVMVTFRQDGNATCYFKISYIVSGNDRTLIVLSSSSESKRKMVRLNVYLFIYLFVDIKLGSSLPLSMEQYKLLSHYSVFDSFQKVFFFFFVIDLFFGGGGACRGAYRCIQKK